MLPLEYGEMCTLLSHTSPFRMRAKQSVTGLGGAVTENAEGKAAGADADADAPDASAAPEEA